MKNLKILNQYILRYKWHLILGIVFVTLSNYLRSLIPQKIRDSLDYILDKTKQIKEGTLEYNEETISIVNWEIAKFALIVLGLALLMGVFMYFMRQTVIVMSRLIEYDLRKDIFRHYEKLHLAFFKQNKTGDLMSRVSEDVSQVRMYLGPGILYGINLTALFVMVLYAMFNVSVSLSLWTLLPLPFLSISIYFVSSLINQKSEIIQRQLAKLTSISQEVYSGIRVIKSYTKEDQFSEYFENQSDDYKSKSLDLAYVNALFFPLMILMIGISTILTIYIGAWQVSKGTATAGNIAEFVIYINYLTWPFTSIGWIASIIQTADASQKRINEFLETEPAVQNIENALDVKMGDIEFKNVSFKYPDTGITALKNINFKLKKGEKLAIVGKTASGKSTIADLLVRLYDTTEGNILIHGTDIKQFDLYSLRRQIAYVTQDVFLFSDTIENNIKFSNSEATTNDVMRYADYSAVKDDIMGLPNGFNTKIGERGVTLSGGQKQRVSIARAFIKDPELVILDDCLSAVDTTTEQKILHHLDNNLKDKTAIIITHRIYSMLTFDHILVLNEGQMVEFGTHDELLKIENGHYSELYEQQKTAILNN